MTKTLSLDYLIINSMLITPLHSV